MGLSKLFGGKKCDHPVENRQNEATCNCFPKNRYPKNLESPSINKGRFGVASYTGQLHLSSPVLPSFEGLLRFARSFRHALPRRRALRSPLGAALLADALLGHLLHWHRSLLLLLPMR